MKTKGERGRFAELFFFGRLVGVDDLVLQALKCEEQI